MINTISKKTILILLFSMLFVLLFPKTINAALIEKHRTDDKQGLYDYGSRAVGNTLRIWRTGENLNVSDDEKANRFIQDRESSHVYCIQHNKPTVKKDFFDYPIKNYVKIRGNVATNSAGVSVTNSQNFVLANLLYRKSRPGEPNYDALKFIRGYGGNGDDEIRNLALKHYMTTSGWMSNVGTKLGISDADVSYYNMTTDSGLSSERKAKVENLINTVTRNFEDTTPTMSSNLSMITAGSDMKEFGPITFTFTGSLESIKLYNGSTEVTGTKTFEIKRNNQTITTSRISDIKSGDSVKIKKSNTNEVTRIQATSSGDIVEAEIWFCVKSNAKQNLIAVHTEEYKDQKATVNITVTKPASTAVGMITVRKVDAVTKALIKPSETTDKVATFRIFKTGSNGGWLKGGKFDSSINRYTGTYQYKSGVTDGTVYEAKNGVLRIEKLELGTYRIYEIGAPEGYGLMWQAGYGKDSNYPKYVYCGSIAIDNNNKSNTIDVKNEKTRYLTIYKTDAKNKKDLEGAGFKLYNVNTKKWVKLKSDGTGYEAVSGMQNAGIFEMKGTQEGKYVNYPIKSSAGKNGIRIFGLDDGTYRIYEAKAPSGTGANGNKYELSRQTGYGIYEYDTNKKLEYVNTGKEVTINSSKGIYSKAAIIANTDEQLGSLIIYKNDSNDNGNEKKGLEGAGFKIRIGSKGDKWLKGKRSDKYEYNATFEEATTYRMEDIYSESDDVTYPIDSDKWGKGLRIDGLNDGEYHIYEVRAPDGYILEAQTGYTKEKVKVKVDGKETEVTRRYVYNSSWKKEIPYKDESGRIIKERSVQITNQKSGSLTIYKRDEEATSTKGYLKAGFKIEVIGKGWLANTTAPYKYDAKFKDATTYKLDDIYDSSKTIDYPAVSKDYGNGLRIDGLQAGTYKVIEVEAPEGYLLKHQNGYKETKFDGETAIYANNGDTQRKISFTTTNATTGSDVEVAITNIKKVSIEGFVWIDKPTPKDEAKNLYDSKYVTSDGVNSIDTKLKGVKVQLIDRRTEKAVITGKDANGRNIDYVTTDSNGKYIFDSLIKLSELDEYYVQFDYSGLNSLKATYKDTDGTEKKYTNYIPVTFYQYLKNSPKTNTSKAMMTSVAEDFKNLSGMARTYYGIKENWTSSYGLKAIGNMNTSTLTLSEINLGIKKIPDAHYNVTQNIAYVKIAMKGSTYTYTYGGTGDKSRVAAPKVHFQGKGDIHSYSAEIYPSDISYNIEHSTDELKVYVVYRIDITNLTNNNIEDLYVEDKLNIRTLKNYYDGNRYTLEKAYDLKNDDIIKKDFDNWGTYKANGTFEVGKVTSSNRKDTSGNVKANEKVVEYNLEKYKTGIPKEGTTTSYIEFKVNESAIEDILKNPTGIIEDFPTEAEAIGYHNYHREDYSWKNLTQNQSIKYPHNHITPDETRNDTAPYLIFKLGENRTISGTVFKDNVITTNGEVLGNGEYEEGTEKGLEGVTVELVDIASNNGEEITNVLNLPTSDLYPKNNITSANLISKKFSVKARVTTGEDGRYTLAGIVPGYYYLRFIYGNGNYVIKDLNGNTIENGTVESKIKNGNEKQIIDAKNYKSTVVKNEKVRKALKEKNDTSWYKKLDKENLSVAIDKLETKKEVTDGPRQNIIAGSAKLQVTVENDKNGDSANIDQNAKFNANGKEVLQEENTLHSQSATDFNGLNFGIIEVPTQYAEISKLITNVRIMNAQGNVLYNGNPENVLSRGAVALSDLDNEKNGGSTYVRAEMLQDSLYGSTMELTYEVKIINKSDINYYNDNYYWYGIPEEDKEVTLLPKDVKEYLDKTLIYVEEKSDKDKIDTSLGMDSITVDENAIKVQVMKLLFENSVLYTDKINNRANEKTTSDSIKIVARRLLSDQDDDLETVSRARIEAIERKPDPKDSRADDVKNDNIKITPVEVHTNGMQKAISTITPPTGEDRSTTTIYVIAGIVALIVLSAGIVIIKKKV